MSKYTTELRYICETNTSHSVEGSGFNSVEEIINDSHSNIFNFDYPIFDNQYRAILEKKIIRHFYTREICEETVGLWKLRLSDTMNLIMPYYNQLYESAALVFNPFYNFDITKTGSKQDDNLASASQTETATATNSHVSDGTNAAMSGFTQSKESSKESAGKEITNSSKDESSTGSDTLTKDFTGSESKSNSEESQISATNQTDTDELAWNYFSDTPQGGVTALDNLSYLTNATKNTADNSEVQTRSETDTKSGIEASVESSTTDETRSKNASGAYTATGYKVKADDTSVTDDINFEDYKNSLDHAEQTDNKNSTKDHNRVEMAKNMIEYTEHVIGKNNTNSYSKMLLEFRKTFLNIDKMIIDELEPLFFGLW